MKTHFPKNIRKMWVFERSFRRNTWPTKDLFFKRNFFRYLCTIFPYILNFTWKIDSKLVESHNFYFDLLALVFQNSIFIFENFRHSKFRQRKFWKCSQIAKSCLGKQIFSDYFQCEHSHKIDSEIKKGRRSYTTALI